MVSDELQLTLVLMFRVLPSLNVPVAVNGWLELVATDTSPPSEIELRLAALTVKVVVSCTDPEVAEIWVLPRLRAVDWPVTSTDAMFDFEDAHVTEFVRSAVEPSE